MIGQAIPQDNRIAHKNMEQSKQVKYCLNLQNNAQMLCFKKLTGEYKAKNILYFILWEYIFKKTLFPHPSSIKTNLIKINSCFNNG